ncbi:uncharacterized protein SAPINGB_P003812 [Magnusiomyces paraingens]|uniref:Pre-mRNA-splicing factor SLT11 n=1 Tax=Magnusiomyces paraingens TaxID=2606893 RepID=A0A5E8BSA7_9ASCO|nr:uncharacterized protein SAPINGB_P003812 [Saprochaete ingens]VVT53911.1 unnamed protein product [Saprochaete ingens]
MPPKADINKATWEDTEVPAVCERCLGSNPYIRMTRERYGAECKLCARPYTVFRWQPEGSMTGGGSAGSKKPKKTSICLTCARQKNCCQSCMLDLTYGLPLHIRDTALKMISSSGDSTTNTSSNMSNAIIRQYIAQNFEYNNGSTTDDLEDEERRRLMEESEGAKNLLKHLATAMPYYKRQYPSLENTPGHLKHKQQNVDPAPVNNKALVQDVGKIASKLPLNGNNIPPKDTSITSLFIMGIEDDLPEYAIRDYFSKYGAISSIVCIHRARCGFINFANRAGAEAAASSVPAPAGKLVINGCKLRIAWSKPRLLGSSHAEHSRLGQIVRKAMRQRDFKDRASNGGRDAGAGGSAGTRGNDGSKDEILAPPSLSGPKTKYKTAQSGYEG